ncbi:MAG: hypothetical protein ACRYFR_02475 [Janthinobacterium lividum]
MPLLFSRLHLCLLVAIFLLGLHRTFAQTAPSMARTDSLVAASQARGQAQRLAAQAGAATDTVGALHRLFAAKRQRGHLLAGGLVLFTGLSIAIDRSASRPREFQDLAYAAFVVVVVVPILTANYCYHVQYSHKKERRAIAAFEAHRLPAATKARLLGKYFQLPANAVRQ